MYFTEGIRTFNQNFYLSINSMLAYTLDPDTVQLMAGKESRIDLIIKNYGTTAYYGDLGVMVRVRDYLGWGNDRFNKSTTNEIFWFPPKNYMNVTINPTLYFVDIQPGDSITITLKVPYQLFHVHHPLIFSDPFFTDGLHIFLVHKDENDYWQLSDDRIFTHYEGFSILPAQDPKDNINELMLLMAKLRDDNVGQSILESSSLIDKMYSYSQKYMNAKNQIPPNDEEMDYYTRLAIGDLSFYLLENGIEFGPQNALLSITSIVLKLEQNIQQFAMQARFNDPDFNYWLFIQNVFQTLTGTSSLFRENYLLGNLNSNSSIKNTFEEVMKTDSLYFYKNVFFKSDSTLSNTSFEMIFQEDGNAEYIIFNRQSGENLNVAHFSNVSVSPNTNHIIVLSDTTTNYELKIDFDGNGTIDSTAFPDSVSYTSNLRPNPAMNLTINHDSSSINLNWDQSNDSLFYRYVVYQDTSNIQPTSLLDSIATTISSNFEITSYQFNTYYNFWVSVLDSLGQESTLGNSVGLFVSDPTSVENTYEIPISFELKQNYPNPFNPVTNIEYSLPKLANVKIQIFNVLGQKIKELVNSQLKAGKYNIVWDGTNDFNERVSTGVYFYRIIAGNYVKTNKMILLK